MGRKLRCEIRDSWLHIAINPLEEETLWDLGVFTKCRRHSDTTESCLLPPPTFIPDSISSS